MMNPDKKTVAEKISFIEGLFQGCGIDQSSNEGVIFKALIDTVYDLSKEVEDLRAQVEEMGGQVDAIDEDLDSLEEVIYDFGDHDHHHHHHCGCEDEDDDEDFFDGSEIYEYCCPTCRETVCVDASMLEEGQTNCPNCGELIEFDLGDEDAIEDEPTV